MANLIVTVIAIALVAVAALMGAYYGGSAFLQGTAKANAATLVNQGSQIAAGWVLYKNDTANTAPTVVLSMVPEYVTENPQLPAGISAAEWELVDGSTATIALSSISSEEVCQRIQSSATGSTDLVDITGGIDDDFATFKADAASVDMLVETARYGCAALIDGAYVVGYKIQ